MRKESPVGTSTASQETFAGLYPNMTRWFATRLIESQFGPADLETHTAILSLVGNREEAQEALDEERANAMGIEILSDTGHAVRMLTQTTDMAMLLKELSQLCGLKHTVQTRK